MEITQHFTTEVVQYWSSAFHDEAVKVEFSQPTKTSTKIARSSPSPVLTAV
jgi:hypothetical protein